MEDSFAPKIGTLGTIFYVDDTGTIHVNLADGSKLGTVFGVAKIEKIELILLATYISNTGNHKDYIRSLLMEINNYQFLSSKALKGHFLYLKSFLFYK